MRSDAGLNGGSGGGGAPCDGGGTATQSDQPATAGGVSGTLTGYGFNGMGTTQEMLVAVAVVLVVLVDLLLIPYPWNTDPDGTTGGPGRENSYLDNTPYY